MEDKIKIYVKIGNQNGPFDSSLAMEINASEMGIIYAHYLLNARDTFYIYLQTEKEVKIKGQVYMDKIYTVKGYYKHNPENKSLDYKLEKQVNINIENKSNYTTLEQAKSLYMNTLVELKNESNFKLHMYQSEKLEYITIMGFNS